MSQLNKFVPEMINKEDHKLYRTTKDFLEGSNHKHINKRIKSA